MKLARDHPVGAAFLDESGIIAKDRYFAVGLLKCEEPSRLLRRVQRVRDQKHWYTEMKFSNVTRYNLELHKAIVDECLVPGIARFFCFVADRTQADPVDRFGTQWDAYAKLAEQLVVAAMQPEELVSVMADNYSTPSHILFEEDLRASVNRRLGRLAVVSVCRLDSKSCDGLQLVDILTSAVTQEFRAAAGLAGTATPKAKLAEHVRAGLGVTSCLQGVRVGGHSVAVYAHGSWSPADSK